MVPSKTLREVSDEVLALPGVLSVVKTACNNLNVFLVSLDYQIPETLRGVKLFKRFDPDIVKKAKKKGTLSAKSTPTGDS